MLALPQDSLLLPPMVASAFCGDPRDQSLAHIYAPRSKLSTRVTCISITQPVISCPQLHESHRYRFFQHLDLTGFVRQPRDTQCVLCAPGPCLVSCPMSLLDLAIFVAETDDPQRFSGTRMPRLCARNPHSTAQRFNNATQEDHNTDKFYYLVLHREPGNINTSPEFHIGASRSLYPQPVLPSLGG